MDRVVVQRLGGGPGDQVAQPKLQPRQHARADYPVF
jgi:hypothetical protein